MTGTYGDLMRHLESAHGAKVLTCQLCQNIFLNYGSFKSHVCYGTEELQALAGAGPSSAKFACKQCDRQDLQTFLEFQHHFRKAHHVCEICFTVRCSQEECAIQPKNYTLNQMKWDN